MVNNYLRKIVLLTITVFSGTCVIAQNYTVSPIPSEIYTSTVNVAFSADDTNSALITLPFQFTFFGNNYTQLSVSTNGYIDFRTESAGQFSPYQFNSQIPDVSFPVKNSILGCFHDLDNSNAEGTITYSIIGTAPYRRLVVMFNNNSQFQCEALKSSFQIILYETLNIIDSQVISKPVCAGWNSGRAVIGIINLAGNVAYTPAGRNTGSWSASNEGWRFSPEISQIYNFTKCDNDINGFESFNLAVAQNDLSPENPGSVFFYNTMADATLGINPLPINYVNVSAFYETIFANVDGVIKKVELRTINCENDYDMDHVPTAAEDLNNDTNLANDDTDSDGIPNFFDNDDDGDLILTSVEYVFSGRNAAISDTDGDGIPNYLDNDDDGDGVLTINEDYNNNNNPLDDDINFDDIPDYLQNEVYLDTANHELQNNIRIYPNPVSNVLHVNNSTSEKISKLSIYTVSGILINQTTASQSTTEISVADFQSGVYFVKVEAGNSILNYKFIKD